MTQLVLLPGGPGLGCDTLAGLRDHNSSLSLVCVEHIGATDFSYSDLLSTVRAQVANVNGPYVLVGHSFGGIQASALFLEDERAAGIVCLATPISAEAFARVGRQYEDAKTERIARTEKKFSEAPSDQTFREWISSYGTLYFSERNLIAGERMLLNASVEHRAFLGARAESAKQGALLARLKADQRPKLYLAGVLDRLVPLDVARAEASAGGFEFQSVSDAGHFLGFDNPAATLEAISSFLKSNVKLRGT